MRYLFEITFIIISVQYGYTKPTAGINIKKQLEIQLNPAPFKKLELFFERWSRFGKFGIQHKIEKRDTTLKLNDETFQNGKENLLVLPVKTESVPILATPAQNVVILSTVQPLASTERTVPDLLENDIIIPVEEPSNEITQPVQPFLAVPGEPNVMITMPVETTTKISTGNNIAPIQTIPSLTPSPNGLYTNILQNLNNLPPNGGINQNLDLPIQNQNFIIRGSRFAAYFGSMLLRLLSQYLSGARVALGNYTGQSIALS